MEKQLKIGTWNLCLGLGNKKDTVTRYLNELNIGICCLQETEVTNDMQENLLNCGNYNIELEDNTVKKRAGIYIRSDINYIRRNDLEEQDSHIVIIDVVTVIPIRIVCIYRSFRPPRVVTAHYFFKAHLDLLDLALGLRHERLVTCCYPKVVDMYRYIGLFAVLQHTHIETWVTDSWDEANAT